jgi:short-subunit dehydrogenase
MTVSLVNKVVLITGASSGFGADAAHLFAREGCIVVLAARRLDRLQALAAELQRAGCEALAVPADISRQGEIERLVNSVLDVYGRIDILFNNAGFGRLDWLENLDPGRDIRTQVEVNLLGVILVTRAVLPSMLARRSGQVINMASVAGRIAPPLYTVYAATKFGVRGFTDALRREVGPFGIRVSGIYPGPAATEFGAHGSDKLIRSYLKLPPFLWMRSEDVARRVVGLAKRPRRAVYLPWYYGLAFFFDTFTPGLVDWFLKVTFTKRFHRLPEDGRNLSVLEK